MNKEKINKCIEEYKELNLYYEGMDSFNSNDEEIKEVEQELNKLLEKIEIMKGGIR